MSKWFEVATKKAGLDEATAMAAVNSEDFLRVGFYHELIEKASSLGFGKAPGLGEAHQAAQVLVAEGGMVAATKNPDIIKLFAAVRKLTPEEYKYWKKGFKAVWNDARKINKWTEDFGLPMDRPINRVPVRPTTAAPEVKPLGLTQEQLAERSARSARRRERLLNAKQVKKEAIARYNARYAPEDIPIIEEGFDELADLRRSVAQMEGDFPIGVGERSTGQDAFADTNLMPGRDISDSAIERVKKQLLEEADTMPMQIPTDVKLNEMIKFGGTIPGSGAPIPGQPVKDMDDVIRQLRGLKASIQKAHADRNFDAIHGLSSARNQIISNTESLIKKP